MTIKSALRVLLVEDDPDHARLAKNAIMSSKNRTYVVDTCGSVEEAMERLVRDPVHLILSDFHLPGKSGLGLLEWLKAENLDIPFVMITGSGDEKTVVKAMQGGAYNYIVKDGAYFNVLPHVVDETFLEYLADKEKKRFELEIRTKNVQLEKANRELRKLDQLKSDFIASVSHEFRTPLNSIRESIALILDGVVDTSQEKGKQVLGIAKRSIDRLTMMINDLLDLSKLEAGKMRLHIEPYDFQVLVDEVLGSLKSLAERKSVNLCFEPIKEFPKVACDADRMIQVLMNLVGNAVKFTPENGSVAVRLEVAANRHVNIIVSDTGVGIAKENLARIFERFEQVKETAPSGYKGTGLGLSICKELVELHDGNILAESELGKGSRFIVSLPLVQGASKEKLSLVQEKIA